MKTKTETISQGIENKPCEDSFSIRQIPAGDNIYIVTDGATGLGTKQYSPKEFGSDAQWLSTQLAILVGEKVIENGLEIRDAIKTSLSLLRQEFAKYTDGELLRPYEQPTTTIAAVLARQGKLHLYRLGDTEIIVKLKSGEAIHLYDELLNEVDRKVLDMVVRACEENDIPIREGRQYAIPRLRYNRTNINKPETYYIASLDGAGVDYGDERTYDISDVESFLIASDGFMAGREIYELSAETFIELSAGNLNNIAENIKTTYDDDYDRTRYPRLKHIDDITAIRVKLLG